MGAASPSTRGLSALSAPGVSRHDVATGGSVALAAVTLTLTIGCGAGDAGRPATVVRDSAGIEIVENRLPPADAGGEWRVGAEPVLRIGVLEGDEVYQLFQVSGAARLRDGRIAVVNRGTQEIRIFDARGLISARHGRSGDGPGEFRAPALAGILADTLVVYDGMQRRITLVHPDAGFIRDVAVGEEGGGFPVVQGMFADGTLAFGGGMSFNSRDGFPSGLIRPASAFRAVTPAGEPVADFGEYPGAEMYAEVSGGAFRARGLPFGRITSVAVGDSLLYIGTADAWEIKALAVDGSLRRRIRLDAPVRPVTGTLRNAWAEEAERRETDANARAELHRLLAEMPIPETLPPYGAMHVDEHGFLWVGDVALPGVAETDWWIFDANGRLAGRTKLPSDVRILEIGDVELIVVARTDLDFEEVRVLRLERPSA